MANKIMAVLEIPMPKRCADCRFVDDDELDIRFCYAEKQLFADANKRRPAWCPLIIVGEKKQ